MRFPHILSPWCLAHTPTTVELGVVMCVMTFITCQHMSFNFLLLLLLLLLFKSWHNCLSHHGWCHKFVMCHWHTHVKNMQININIMCTNCHKNVRHTISGVTHLWCVAATHMPVVVRKMWQVLPRSQSKPDKNVTSSTPTTFAKHVAMTGNVPGQSEDSGFAGARIGSNSVGRQGWLKLGGASRRATTTQDDDTHHGFHVPGGQKSTTCTMEFNSKMEQCTTRPPRISFLKKIRIFGSSKKAYKGIVFFL